MIPNAAIRNLIREDKMHQIYSQMQIGQGQSGMQTLNQHLAQLYHANLITLEEAIGTSSDSNELQQIIASGAGTGGAAKDRRP
jgi:twitching motility protein PilT